MRVCPLCEGPETKCRFCNHVHCDEEGCMPIECAKALGEE